MPKTRHSDHYQFPYVRFHGRYYPLIPISLKKGEHQVNTFALIDSGASFSVFRPEIANALHLPRKPKEIVRMGTIHGGINIGMSNLNVTIENLKFKSKIGFSKSPSASFNILGREGFFRHFAICFNEKMKNVVLVPMKGART